VKPVLASTLHDPQNRLESLIKEQNPKLEELFHEKIVTLSSSTSRETLEILQKLGYEASYGDESVASTYVIALRRATEKTPSPSSTATSIDSSTGHHVTPKNSKQPHKNRPTTSSYSEEQKEPC